jgi:glycogen debranching enzyme
MTTDEDIAARSRGPISSYSLKHEHTFMVADALGDIRGGSDGLFRNDTRVLSRLVLTISDTTPALLRSAVSDDNTVFRINATNRPLPKRGEHDATPEGVIHLERYRFVWSDRLYERMRFTNYGEKPLRAAVAIAFAADFADIFEVRGIQRARRGQVLPAVVGVDWVELDYLALDSVPCRSSISFSVQPALIDAERAEFDFRLPRHTAQTLYLEIGPELGERPGSQTFRCARHDIRASFQPLGDPLERRSRAAGDRVPDGAVSVRRDTVVFHALWARRDHHCAPDIMARSRSRSWCARVSCAPSSARAVRRVRRDAREDSPRD